jgi:hypothetical protein
LAPAKIEHYLFCINEDNTPTGASTIGVFGENNWSFKVQANV